MEFSTFVIFSATTLVVIVTPGPAALMVTSQSAGNGFRKALAGIAGVASANVVFFLLSAAGIAALILASSLLFTIIKWAGVAYLAYLGLGAVLGSSGGIAIRKGREMPPHRLYAQGFVIEFANPKALLYFAAILPQFLDPDRAVAPQILVMGATTLALDVTVYSGYAALGHAIARSGIRPGVVAILNKLAGSALLFAAWRVARMAH